MSLVHHVVEPQTAVRATRGYFLGSTQQYVALLYFNRIVFRAIPEQTAKFPVVLGEEELVVDIPSPPMIYAGPDEDTLPCLGGAFFAVGRRRDMLILQIGNALFTLSVNIVEGRLEYQGCWGLSIQSSPVMKRSSASLVSLADQPRSTKGVLALSPNMPEPKPSPDGTQLFLATRNKHDQVVLVVMSCYGKEVVRQDVEYLDVLTLGWITNDLLYFVYLNQKFHKKFQTVRLVTKAKNTGLFGMGRRLVKPQFVYEVNSAISSDFVASTPDAGGGPDLLFNDDVILGHRRGGYIRINYRAGTWEQIANAKNVVGAVSVGENNYWVVSSTSGSKSAPSNIQAVSCSVVSEGTLHAVKASTEVIACLSSKHAIGSNERFVLRLLDLGKDGLVLDYKHEPMRLYRVKASGAVRIEIADEMSPPPIMNNERLAIDFLIKTEQAMYTRDPNGNDYTIRKIMNSTSSIDIMLDRPGLVYCVKRDAKSFYAVFTSQDKLPPQVTVVDESHRATKLKTKATYTFGEYSSWHVRRVVCAFRNVLIVGLTSVQLVRGIMDSSEPVDSPPSDWVLFAVSFVGSTTKHDPVPPKATLIYKSKSPEVLPMPLKIPACPTKGDSALSKRFALHIYNNSIRGFFRHFVMTIWSNGELKLDKAPELTPVVLHEADGVVAFMDFRGSRENVYLVGKANTVNAKVTDSLAVDAQNMADGQTIVLPTDDLRKTVLWVFDSNGQQFREFTYGVVPADRKFTFRQHEQALEHRTGKEFPTYELGKNFSNDFFYESSSCNSLRSLPDIAALVSPGVGADMDAEVYLKTPDFGFYAVFRIQNKKLHGSLKRLERVVLEKYIGVWLPDSLKESWLAEQSGSEMISGHGFAAFWRLNEEQQVEVCREADVDIELMRKVRLP